MSCKIHNNSDYDISEMKPLVRNLYGFAKDRLGFKKPPSINFISDYENHPMLGKTAHYDPSSMEVTIYVDGRHPKDMMRSIAHELVHHIQNERGMFDEKTSTGEAYAQKDPHLRKMEEEAYLEGNMCFRDWEDQYKSKNKDIFYERRIRKMSTKKWKNKELNNLLNERWGFSMNLDKLNENINIQEEEVNEITMKASGDTDSRSMSDIKNKEAADLDNSGDLSDYETARGQAIEDSMKDEETEVNESDEQQPDLKNVKAARYVPEAVKPNWIALFDAVYDQKQTIVSSTLAMDKVIDKMLELLAQDKAAASKAKAKLSSPIDTTNED